MNTPKVKVVFMGTPDFSVPSLELLYNHPQVDLLCVVSMPDRKAGRGHKLQSPEVIEFAKKNKIKFFQTSNINNDESFQSYMSEVKPDAFFVLAFAQFLNQKTLNIPKVGCFNIHTSLLPKFRGAAPIQYAILNNEKQTGVSIQKMVLKMDAGDIVHSYPTEIAPNETGGQLYTRLKFLAALSLNNFLQDIITNNISAKPQDESLVSFAPTLKREDGLLSFEKKSSGEIYNQIRALYPWPGTYCFLNGKRLKVLNAIQGNEGLQALEVKIVNEGLAIGCREGSIILTHVQLEGKKATSSLELINGIKGDLKISCTQDGEAK